MNVVTEYQEALPALKAEHLTRLFALEDSIRESGEYDYEGHTTHWHCNGSYVREFFLPKGHVCTGKVHRFACINILLKGKIKVVQSDGSKVIEAPTIYISDPGEKKALYALEDTIFLNVHATDETDQDKLEAHFIVPAQELLEDLT